MKKSNRITGKFKNYELIIIICLALFSAAGILSTILMSFGSPVCRYDTDFKNGTSAFLYFEDEVKDDDVKNIYSAVENIPGVSVYCVATESQSKNIVLIKTSQLSELQQNRLCTLLKNTFNIENDNIFWVKDSEPVVSPIFILKYIAAVIFVIIIASVYVAFRFRLKSASFFALTTFANIFSTIAVCIILRLTVNLNLLGSIFVSTVTVLCFNILIINFAKSKRKENNYMKPSEISQFIKSLLQPYLICLLFLIVVVSAMIILSPHNVYSLVCPYIVSCAIQIPILLLSPLFYIKNKI